MFRSSLSFAFESSLIGEKSHYAFDHPYLIGVTQHWIQIIDLWQISKYRLCPFKLFKNQWSIDGSVNSSFDLLWRKLFSRPLRSKFVVSYCSRPPKSHPSMQAGQCVVWLKAQYNLLSTSVRFFWEKGEQKPASVDLGYDDDRRVCIYDVFWIIFAAFTHRRNRGSLYCFEAILVKFCAAKFVKHVSLLQSSNVRVQNSVSHGYGICASRKKFRAAVNTSKLDFPRKSQPSSCRGLEFLEVETWQVLVT